MMIEIKEIKVLDLFSTNFLYINFLLNDTSEDISVYQFNIYKSSNQGSGTFILLAPNVQDFSYVDYNVNLYDMAINYFYKVEVVNTKTNEKHMSDILGRYEGHEADDVAQAIIYNYETYLQNVINNQMYLLQRKHNGQLCTVCYDPIRRRPSNSLCPVCFNTKYVGGYYSPVPINVNLMNSPGRSESFTISDDAEQMSPIEAWTGNFPIIHAEDVLVDRNNERYIVISWQPTYKNYYLVRQTIQMQRIPKTDIVYTVSVLNNNVNIDKIEKDNNIVIPG